ncbi:MAG TPA: ABC transporter permease [Spirochaetales bacterium]|nr:ABC transporter permease [Spirochaetales bacterium]
MRTDTQTENLYEKERRENRRKMRRDFWRRFKKNKSAVFGLIVISILILCAVFANLISPSEFVTKQNPSIRLQPPSAEHWFGTDTYGRDVFTRIIYGSRISLSIGIGSSIFCLVFGGFFGAATAYFGGKFDDIVMRVMDMIMAIPATLLALSIVAALGASMVNLALAVSISYTPRFIRLVRACVLPIVGMDYVEAARAYGSKNFRIIFKEIIPNAIGPIIVETTQSLSGMILEASGLSYIGMGVQAPQPEWGAMLSEAREVMRTQPYLIVIPGVFLILAALSTNLLGDGLRDTIDPRLKS